MEYLLSKSQYEFLRNTCQVTNALVPELISEELNDREVKDLEKKGYTNKGQVTEAMKAIMMTICQPLTIQRQRLINMDASIEQVLYFRQGQDLVCVSENLEGLLIQSPYNNEDDLEAMGQYLGGSILKGIHLNFSLPMKQAYVLAGVWDCVRKNSLGKMFSDEVTDWVRKDELIDFLQKVDSSQSFAFYIGALNDLQMDRSDILDQLKLLEAQDYIEGSERISLTGMTYEVCLRFKQIKTILQLTTALENKNTTYGSEMVILQDGVSDLMLMEIGSKEVTFMGMASIEVIALLEAYYKEPEMFLGDIYEEDDTVGAELEEVLPLVDEEATIPKFCSECGAKRTEGAKFCPECGRKF